MGYPETRFDKWRVERFHKRLNKQIHKAILRVRCWGLNIAAVDVPERHLAKLDSLTYQLTDEWAKAGYSFRVQKCYDRMGCYHIAVFVQ